MALDKQQILSELGSVMNKLQSADCGCMGKLFSNQGGQSAAMGSQLPTCGGCRRGHCHGHGYGGHNHGHGAPCAGEPYNMTPCMGMQCSPPKLYADTYNYLNSNLMQPIVKEVYEDLKSINPANSVVNNPMANQMGLQQQGGGAGMPGNMGMAQNQMPGSDMGGVQDPNMANNQQMANQQMANQQMGYQQMGNQQMGNQQMGYQQMGNQQMGNQQMEQMGNQMTNQPMSQIGGMGPNIVSMMNGDGTKSGKTGQLTPISTGAPQSQVPGGMGGQYSAEMNTMNAATYGGQQVQNQYMQQQDMNNAMNPNFQNGMGGNIQQNLGQPSPSYKVNYTNPAAQQMSANRGKPNYGQHTPGVTKFNEMFPGVMGGDLGFDPMSIAIQMNPANQQQAAMGQMQKLMTGNPIDRILDPSANARTMQPAIAGANAAAASINQPPVSQQNMAPSNQPPMSAQPRATQQNLQNSYTNVSPQQQPQAQQQVYGQVPQQQQQQVYTAVTGAPIMNQNQPPQQNQQQPPQYQQQLPQQYQQPPPQQYQQQNINTQQYQQQQQNIDPNAQGIAPPNLPNIYDGTMADPNAAVDQQSYSAPPDQQMIKEPIYPVDTSRKQLPYNNMKSYQRQYEYNTLGQPVEMLPARLYHPVPETNQQQTLSPQPIAKTRTDQSRFVVKNTVSRTSLMGMKQVGRTPSRGQLQQIYNQYKGSQSYTQQNIRAPGQGATYSEGKINVAQANANHHRHVPVERVGGDTLANNQMANDQIPVKGQPTGQSGDVPRHADNKPHGDIAPIQEFSTKKTRNGLQDLVYTSYPTSAAWSFHGNKDRSPYISSGFRSRRA